MNNFAISEEPDEMQHSSGSTLFEKIKKSFRQNNIILLKNQNLAPLDMYNGLSQVYCIKPEGRIHLYTKG